jgi:hypothetical protein
MFIPLVVADNFSFFFRCYGRRSDYMKKEKKQEPTLAPGMNTSDPLEEEATKKEEENGEKTEVTRLYLDRTPDE